MNKEYYMFPIFPLRRVINYIPGDIIIDNPGHVYQVNDSYTVDKILDSQIQPKYRDKGILGLNFKQEKLFTNITNYYITRYFDTRDIDKTIV